MKILYHSPSHEGGLCEYAVHQGKAIAAIPNIELFWQTPANVFSPEGVIKLPSLPIPISRKDWAIWKRAWDFLSWILATNRALNQAIAEVKPDAVLLPGWSEYFASIWAWRLRRWRQHGVRFGAIIHDPVRDFARGGQALHRLSLRQAYSFLDFAFVHEQVDLDTAGAYQPNIVVIPHGPYPVPDGNTSKSDLRKEFRIPNDARVLLSFGHIRDGKCLDTILEAMVRCPDCHLIVAGREQSGGQKQATYYQDLAVRLEIADRCHWFIGYIPNDQVWKYFRAADLLLLLYSNVFQSMSGVLNVNAQFQLPVLASAGGGPLLSTVKEYGLGLTIENVTRDAIVNVLANYASPAARWDDYVSDHSWENNAQRVVNALRQGDSCDAP